MKIDKKMLEAAAKALAKSRWCEEDVNACMDCACYHTANVALEAALGTLNIQDLRFVISIPSEDSGKNSGSPGTKDTHNCRHPTESKESLPSGNNAGNIIQNPCKVTERDDLTPDVKNACSHEWNHDFCGVNVTICEKCGGLK